MLAQHVEARTRATHLTAPSQPPHVMPTEKLTTEGIVGARFGDSDGELAKKETSVFFFSLRTAQQWLEMPPKAKAKGKKKECVAPFSRLLCHSAVILARRAASAPCAALSCQPTPAADTCAPHPTLPLPPPHLAPLRRREEEEEEEEVVPVKKGSAKKGKKKEECVGFFSPSQGCARLSRPCVAAPSLCATRTRPHAHAPCRSEEEEEEESPPPQKKGGKRK